MPQSEGEPKTFKNRYVFMKTVLTIAGVWFALNLAIFAFILWQRSPHFRHRMFRLTLGAFVPGERKQAHALVNAAHHRR